MYRRIEDVRRDGAPREEDESRERKAWLRFCGQPTRWKQSLQSYNILPYLHL